MSKQNYLEKFIDFIDKTHRTEFSLDALRRKLRPFFKTTAVGNMYCFKLKGTDIGFMVRPETIVGANQYYEVVCSKHKNITFSICPKDNKDFLEKITFKFQIFQ